MLNKLGIQLYTIRDFMKDEASIDAAFARLAEIGYTEAQTAGCTISPESFGALAKKHGIKIVGTHYDWEPILNDYDDNIYTWDYVMEQRCKAQWDELHFGDSNPYDELPELKIYTYDLGKIIGNKKYVELEDKAFNFREFFTNSINNNA